MTFKSPIPNIFNTYHHLALRAAVFADVDLNIIQEVRFFGHCTRRNGLVDERYLSNGLPSGSVLPFLSLYQVALWHWLGEPGG